MDELYRKLTTDEAAVLLEYSKEIAPELVQFCMVQVQSMIPNQPKVQLHTPMLAGLTFDVAGFLAAEYLKRCNGEVPVGGLNKEIPQRE